MEKAFDKLIGWTVTGIFVFGVYAFAHYLLKFSDGEVLAYAMCLIWFDLAHTVNNSRPKTEN